MENLGHLTWERLQQLQEQCYPFLPACAVFSHVQTMAWLTVFRTFNMHKCQCICHHVEAVQTSEESFHWKLTLMLHQGLEPALYLTFTMAKKNTASYSKQCQLSFYGCSFYLWYINMGFTLKTDKWRRDLIVHQVRVIASDSGLLLLCLCGMFWQMPTDNFQK